MRHRIFEKIWLFIFAICAVIFVYSVTQKGFGESYIWLVWMIFSLLFYFRRKKTRIDLMKEK
jgi:hypothetical protein